jgi:hypothetical protein
MINKLYTVVALWCATTMCLIAQTTNPYAPKWTKEGYYYTANAENTESTLTISAKAFIDGVPCDSAYEIGVFVGDRCVVRNNIYSSERYYERHGYYTTLNVKANRNEILSFRIYDHRNNVEVAVNEPPATIVFTAEANYGLLAQELYKLTFNKSTSHRAEALELTDATDLPFEGSQYGITADGIACSYTRNAYLDGGYETIVLPFDAEIEEMKAAGFAFEKLETITETSIRFVELEEDEILKAGVAYIFRYAGTPSDDRMEVTFTGRQNKITDALVNNDGWTGTFSAMDGSQIAGKYILNISGSMMQKAGSGASLSPYHAYFEAPQGVNMSRMMVIHNGKATGIESISGNGNDDSRTFDLSGRAVNTTHYKGIVISNRKKVFVK